MNSFEIYKQNVLAKATGANIHKLTGSLGAIATCYKHIELGEGKKENWERIIKLGYAQIYKEVFKADYEMLYCIGFNKFN